MRSSTRRAVTVAGLVGLLLAAPSPLRADFVTIDFQELINSGQLTTGTVVRDQFAPLGVTFSLERVQDPRFPGPIADRFGLPQTAGLFNTFNYFIPILADFLVPVTSVTFASILDSPLSVEAFDRDGNLLERLSIGGAPDVGTINTSTEIARLRMLNDSGTGYLGRSDLTILTRLTFGEQPVPEPATILLLGVGALAVGGCHWRRKRGEPKP